MDCGGVCDEANRRPIRIRRVSRKVSSTLVATRQLRSRTLVAPTSRRRWRHTRPGHAWKQRATFGCRPSSCGAGVSPATVDDLLRVGSIAHETWALQIATGTDPPRRNVHRIVRTLVLAPSSPTRRGRYKSQPVPIRPAATTTESIERWSWHRLSQPRLSSRWNMTRMSTTPRTPCADATAAA